MKKLLFLIYVIFATITVSGQTNTWTGATDSNWSTPGNWSLGLPTVAHDVVIPAGSTVVLNVAGATKSISINGNANLTIGNELSFTNTSSFGSGSIVTWSSGNLNGGGILNAAGTMNFTSNSIKYIYGNTTLNNTGTVNMIGAGGFYISDGIFNNLPSGVFEFKAGSGSITYNTSGSHVINNSGTILLAAAQSNTIDASFTNSGVLTATAGNLIVNCGIGATFNGGTYNISSGANITLESTVNLSGTMNGVLNGKMVSNASLAVSSLATFAFTGSSTFNWNSGNLTGGGTLVNNAKITLESNSIKYIYGNTTKLNNNATMEHIGAGAFYISDGTFNNNIGGTYTSKLNSGVISNNTSGLHRLNNFGIIKKADLGTFSINCEIVNSGALTAEGGVLTLYPIQNSKMSGGTYNVSTGAVMNWSDDMYIEGTLSGVLSGPLNWNAQVFVDVASPANLNFTGTTGLVWLSGSINGGGILTNSSPIRLDSNSIKYIYGATILVNNSTINHAGAGSFYISDGTVNNTALGTYDFLNGSGNIYYNTSGTHIFNNAGLIRNSNSAIPYIDIYLVNTGTLQSTVGTLTVGSSLGNVFNGGTYNVSSGAAITLSNDTTISGNLNGILNGPLNWTGSLLVIAPNAATFAFTGSSSVKWLGGNLNGGGILINNAPIELATNSIKYIYGASSLNNNAIINHTGAGSLYISDGTLNNNLLGIYDSKLNSGNISYNTSGVHFLNNFGTIKKSGGGIFTIESELHNTGTLIAETGTTNIQSFYGGTLIGGIYNVSTGAVMTITAPINISGMLTGTLNNPLNWNSSLLVESANPASLNFTGTSAVYWNSGDLTGGGTLTNMSKLSLESNSIKYIYGTTTLANSGLMEIVGAGSLYVSDGILSNLSGGTVDLKNASISYNTSGTHSVINEGLIKHTSGGTYSILTNVTNSGVIDSQSGNLNFASALSLTNTVAGRIVGTNTITLPPAENYTNDGTFAPGGAPGKLSVIGTFKSSPTSVIEVELNSLIPETGHDVLAITGGANFDGTVGVILGFQPAIGDSFTVATTTGTISTCSLASSTMTVRLGLETTFTVACVNNNKVILTVTNVVAVPPIVQDQNFCAGATVADLVASGSSIQWYANAAGGSPLASSVVLASGIYYATQTVNGFESTRQPSNITITTTPMPTAASPQTVADPATVADLAASGTNIQWYANAAGGSVLGASSTIASGTYYVSQTANGCESMRLAVQVTVNSTPNMFQFYVDADGDTFGAGSLVLVAAADANTPPAGYSLDGTDCDDNNNTVYQNASFFIDGDGDGYDNGSTTVCYGATTPSGYSENTLGTDCDDNNITIYQSATLFIDVDGDGYDNGTETVCYGENIPTGYATNTSGTDCNDNDNSIFQSVSLYIDADGDGFDNGSEIFCSGSAIPTGYSETTNGSDCNDNDNTVWQSAELFIDADGDGYDNGSSNICYGASLPEGYADTTLGTDCDDVDENIFQSASLFIDADGDNYDNGSETVCYGATIPTGYKQNTLGSDCNDNNANVNPGATEIPGNGIDDNCNNQIDESTGNGVTTTISPTQCGTTLTAINTLIGAVSVPNATAYRFKVVNNTTTAEQTIIRPVSNFRLTMLASYDYSTSYGIAVEVQQNGVWAGSYGPSCNISTPNITAPGGAAQITPSQCGITLPTISTLIATTSLQGVTGYRFRITNLTDLTGPNQVQVFDRGIHWFSLLMLQRYNYGTTYSIEVAMKTNGDYSAYGNACSITTPSVPALTQCGGTVASTTTNITTTSIPHATMYRFEVTNQSTTTVTTLDRSVHYFTLSQVTGYVPGAQYSVRVAVMTATTWSTFGSSCTITAPGLASRPADEAAGSNSEKFSVIAYPNPYTERFAIETSNLNGGNVGVKIYDMTGRLIDQQLFTADDLQAHQFGDKYPSGVYNVIVSQGESTESLRMIKR